MGENGSGDASPLDFIKVKTETGSDIHYSAFYEGIPDEFRKVAKETLNETEENRKNGLKKLRDFANKEGLACTENDLMLILRNAKFNTKKAEKKLKKYMRARQNVLQLLASMNEDKIDVILDDLLFGFLPYRDKHGRPILFSQPNIHLDLYSVDDADPLVAAFMLFVCNSQLTSVTGLCYIGECKSDSIYNFYPILKQFRKRYIGLALDLPLRFGRVDVVNENFLVRWFYNVVRVMIPEKITSRVSLNGDSYENLNKIFHPDILPENFGGNLPPLNDKCFRQRFLDFVRQLREESKQLPHFEN